MKGVSVAKKVSPFEQAIKDAERRAKRKVRRLENKGVRAANLSPIKDTSDMTPGQRRAYKNQLEKFVSRKTRYVSGHDGAAISYDTARAIRNAERVLNEKREKLWKEVRTKPVLQPGAHMTAEDWRRMTETYDPKTGTYKPNPKSPLYFTEFRQRDLGTLKSEKQAREYIKTLKHAATKGYEQTKNRVLRENAARVSLQLNEPGLAKKIRKLTNAQLYQLITRSDFVEAVFMNSDLPSDAVVSGVVEHLNDLIERVTR